MTITLSAPATIPGTSEVVPSQVAPTVAADGTWSASLYSNADLSPIGTTYSLCVAVPIAYDGFGKATYQTVALYTLTVPTGAGSYNAADISTPVVALAPPATPYVSGIRVGTGPAKTGQVNLFDGPNPWYDVTNPAYGAVGNGVTDDTAAIQAALNAVATRGGIVYMPPGVYKTSGTLTVAPHVSLRGAGRNATSIWYTGSSIAVSAGDPAAANDASTEMIGDLADFNVTGNGLTLAGSVGVRLIKCKNGTVRNVLCMTVETGFLVDGSNGFVASLTFVHPMTSNVKYGMRFTGTAALRGCNNCRVFGGYIFGDGSLPAGGYGVKIEYGDTNSFHGAAVESFQTGYWVTSTNAAGHRFFAPRAELCTTPFLIDTGSVRNAVVGGSNPVTVMTSPNLVLSDSNVFTDGLSVAKGGNSAAFVITNQGGGRSFNFNADSSGNLLLGDLTAPANRLQLDPSGNLSVLGGGLRPATPAGASQTGSLWMGSGVPSNANGTNGDVYLRSDGGTGTALYQKRSGSWVAVV